MILLIAAGLWALVFGKITISKNIRLAGKNARFFGVTLILAAFPVSYFWGYIHLAFLSSLQLGEVLSRLINLVELVFSAILISYPFRLKKQ